MSRPGSDPILVKPQNDVYTGLLAVALTVVLIGLILLFMKANTLFPTKALWQT